MRELSLVAGLARPAVSCRKAAPAGLDWDMWLNQGCMAAVQPRSGWAGCSWREFAGGENTNGVRTASIRFSGRWAWTEPARWKRPLTPGLNGQVEMRYANGVPVRFVLEHAPDGRRHIRLRKGKAGDQPQQVRVESEVHRRGIAQEGQRRGRRAADLLKPQASREAPSLWGKMNTPIGIGISGADLSRMIVVQWRGDQAEAEQLMSQVREIVHDTRFFWVSNTGPVHLAEQALRKGHPAKLPREYIQLIPLLVEGKPVEDPSSKGRILLVENFTFHLKQFTSWLVEGGYEVAVATKPEEAIELTRTDRFHLAVVGAALTFAKQTGVELAKKLRETDSDYMRIILAVDGHPPQAALQGVSEAAEALLDDCLLKPVHPKRLLSSIEEALKRRKLLLEKDRLRLELEISNERLAQLNSFQSKFFATVAHDVKNPLTAIRGYAELLNLRKLEPDISKFVSHILASSKTLEALVSDLVDFAAIESGKLRVSLGPCDLLQVVNDVRGRIDVVAEQRKIKFQVDVPASLPQITGDPLRLGQVIQNLCTNAVQYTPVGGSVTLTVVVNASDAIVSVKDTGIGIAKEDLPRVFESFFQTEAAQKMRRAGFGIGLKIAQDIVRAHGGMVGVESELGKGSHFFFNVPIIAAAPTNTPPAAAPR